MGKKVGEKGETHALGQRGGDNFASASLGVEP